MKVRISLDVEVKNRDTAALLTEKAEEAIRVAAQDTKAIVAPARWSLRRKRKSVERAR